ncbi:hypothetical protein HGRIS_008907 [Hohenbuehelia grisea]|uniref:Secreted protein n=1 Tax=Hohenbuehelia grisea TaxID=104357 RepID=A0ABR3IZJ6_9AGAR
MLFSLSDILVATVMSSLISASPLLDRPASATLGSADLKGLHHPLNGASVAQTKQFQIELVPSWLLQLVDFL